MHKPSYYRARIRVIDSFIEQLNEAILYDEERGKTENLKENEFNRALLRNGYVYPGNLKYPSWEQLEKGIIQELRNKKYSDEPLTFREICTYNTWFCMHPEKIAGTEKVTTSREFPITVSGTKEMVIATIDGKSLNPIYTQHTEQQTKQQPESKLELEAIALELELELLNFSLKGIQSSIFKKPKKKIVLR